MVRLSQRFRGMETVISLVLWLAVLSMYVMSVRSLRRQSRHQDRKEHSA